MEAIVAKLLVPNNKTIEQGTKELKEAFKKPEAVLALCTVVVSSENAEIRQTAAVLLRRRLGKKSHWNRVEPESRKRIKEGMLQALVNEKVRSVQNSIAQLIGILGKHEFPNNTWPEILNFVHTLCSSDNIVDKELGMYTLSIMTEISKDSYLVHLESFGLLFTSTLNSLTKLNCDLAYYTVITMKHIVPIIGGHQQMTNLYFTLLPRVLEIINEFARDNNTKKECEMLEIIEELIEYAVTVVVPHVRLIVEVCLRIGNSPDINDEVKIKAIGVLGWLIRSKSKIMQKENLIEPIIDAMMKVMSVKPTLENEDIEDYYQGDPDEYTPITIATQTLDMIALHVPPEKTVPAFLSRVEPAVQNNDIYAQKAAYLALAVLAEGCSDYIRKKFLEPLLKCVCGGISSTHLPVRNAALFALGQFAEHLQPEISQYASELLPVLFEHLSQIYSQLQQNSGSLPSSLDRIFYALETFCENLDQGLEPYLPALMERLFTAIDPNHWSMQLKKMGFDAVSSAASAVKERMLPYFSKLLEIINVYVNADPMTENFHVLCDALDCLAAIAQTIGNDNFRPLAQETLQLGLRILDSSTDPDNRRAAYALMAALAMVMKEELAPVLPNVVEQMLSTIQSSEGIETVFDEEEKDGVDVYDDSESEDDFEEDIDIASTSSDDSEQCKYMVENAYVEEKEQACITLKEICTNVGAPFLPFIVKSFQEIFKLLNFPQDDMRKAAVDALQQFCISLHKINTAEGKQALYNALNMFIPKCAEIIRSDEERQVVMCALDAYANLLEELKGDVLVGEGHREAIMNCVIDVLNLKTACQDADIDNPGIGGEEETEAEQDELLLEYAGDVIPKFGKAIKPDDFVLYFPNILTLIGNRTKKRNSESQRSFSYGTLAECMEPLSTHVEKFVSQLLKIWYTGAKDSSDEVRNNSIYGLGEMVLHGKDCIFVHYNEILQALSSLAAKESHVGTLDNICGALAKLIVGNPSLVPLEQVFPAFLERLPLREDFQENEAVVKSFYTLYQQGNPLMRQHMSSVTKVLIHIYSNRQTPNEETSHLLQEFLKTIHRDFPEEFTNSASALGQIATESLQKLLS